MQGHVKEWCSFKYVRMNNNTLNINAGMREEFLLMSN